MRKGASQIEIHAPPLLSNHSASGYWALERAL
jgi:hypothetical protein